MIYETLQQLLGEFFENVQEENVFFSLGDLFDPSKLQLSDVFLRTELINALHLPFELRVGYIGDVQVEGFVGFVAGSPLNITLDNVCLVIAHKPVDWHNELAWRYAKELLLALLQCVSNPSFQAKLQSESDSFISPAKWFFGRVQSAIAETTVKIEHVHVRFESEYDGRMMAYGLHLPLIQISTPNADDHILHRRHQNGVTYPSASDLLTSKLLCLSGILIYCDLNATSFVPSKDRHELHKSLREQCSKPFTADVSRDLVRIKALWVKADFARDSSSTIGWGIAALDLVTDEIQIDFDFEQVKALNAELQHVLQFFKHTQRRHWRPSCIDRERITPPRVVVSTTSLLPVAPDPHALAFSPEKQSRTRRWLRQMWQYATYSVLVQLRDGQSKRVHFLANTFNPDVWEKTRQRERFKSLYIRSLSEDALKIIIFGRELLPKSPRAKSTPVPLMPVTALYEPLSLSEQWELSDLVQMLDVYGQRRLRTIVAKCVRDDYATLTAALPSASTTSTPSSPRTSPTHRPSLTVQDLPTGFLVHHHHHFTRSRTESSIGSPPSPGKQHSVAPPTPTSSHHHLQHSASIPVSFQRETLKAPDKPSWSPPSSPFSKQQWFVEALLPSWLLRRSLPLTNWELGPVSLRLHHRPPRYSQLDGDTIASSSTHETFFEMSLESGTGAALLLSRPTVRCLFEFRLGLVRATLFSPDASSIANPSGRHTTNAITTDYIRDANDGFLYVGFKYKLKNTPETSVIAAALAPQDEWAVKAKVCAGRISIEYDDMSLQMALRKDAGYLHDEPTTTETPQPPIRLESATYFSIIQDVVSNWKAFIHRTQSPRQESVTAPTTASPLDVNKSAHSRATKSARIAKLLNALMQQSSCIELDVNGMELRLSMLTRHVESVLSVEKNQALLFDSEEVQVTLPATRAGLENRPLLNECHVHAGGAGIKFHTTKQGRTAVINHILSRLQASMC
ncbi:hypothetical protein Poli38472_004046 [Pythium oligandrum]|uniref:Uncharacterized protein n=1 Tax=Pythium oligandrum TaxID=41045 RepID=A0A8K1CPC1_PYTOL|nr:hypothetical protein Poli38472_004046 [Pythium oligandrum]|eukprot:TMW66281.1 hypothetical protein Poli38472_004046 [Pythium oligandrum]